MNLRQEQIAAAGCAFYPAMGRQRAGRESSYPLLQSSKRGEGAGLVSKGKIVLIDFGDQAGEDQCDFL